MKAPVVGTAFWMLRHRASGPVMVRHEVRDLIDEHFVHRRYSASQRRWIYEVEPLVVWRLSVGRTLFLDKAAGGRWLRRRLRRTK